VSVLDAVLIGHPSTLIYLQCNRKMEWKCKYCSFICLKRSRLLHHYNVRHFQQGRSTEFPYLYNDCPMTFARIGSLKAHISKNHDNRAASVGVTLKCIAWHELCYNLPHMLKHLRRHTTMKELVSCPFQECKFKSNVTTTFSAHLTKKHRNDDVKDV